MAKGILEERAYSTLSECISYINSNEMEKAIVEAQKFIEKCKATISAERNSCCFESSNEALLLGILFRGIQNFANLKQMIASSDWIRNPELIEQVWVEMWDCKDRLEYVSPLITTLGLEWIFNDINLLYHNFYQNFGHGLYVSLSFLAERIICNICGQDIRACEHIQGMIYSGNVCGGIPKGITGDHILVTANPNDPRCRIWPWKKRKEPNEKEGNSYDVCLLSFFTLDDFMHKTTHNIAIDNKQK